MPAEVKWCKHCDAEPVRRWGLCALCSDYWAKFGKLPSAALLVRRQRRKDERRMMHNAARGGW